MNNQIYSFIGLMQKSGKLSSGDDTVEREIKKGNVKLLIIAQDASDNTKKRFEDMAKYRNIPYIYWGTKIDLGSSIGKSSRAIIAVKDRGFANGLLNKVKEESNGGESIVKN